MRLLSGRWVPPQAMEGQFIPELLWGGHLEACFSLVLGVYGNEIGTAAMVPRLSAPP